MAKLVIALGGNALQEGNNISAEDQLQACKHTASSIVELIKQKHKIAIVHGNGPQVGNMIAIIEAANKADNKHPIFPFDVCNAFTQGYIGYHLQNSIGDELAKNGIKKGVATIVTQLEVNKEDPAFQNPTKPIGSFYSKEAAEALIAAEGYQMKEDAGRGWRRVVASPKPLDIIEKNIIKDLFTQGIITISCGGGGIPVIREGLNLIGAAAVIDKDFAAAKLAEILDADMLIILTAVEKVAINFNKPNQEDLRILDVKEAIRHISNNQFAPGSMLPKIQAAISFVQRNPHGKALITSLEKAADGIKGLTGTIIHA
ncbi:putative amino acid kinase YqeA [Gammaproteobacteria bacterium]